MGISYLEVRLGERGRVKRKKAYRVLFKYLCVILFIEKLGIAREGIIVNK